MIRLLSILCLLLLPSMVLGKTFECTEALETIFEALVDENPEVLIVATISTDGKTGTIEVADTTFNAEYQVEGFDRAWRFFTGKGQEFGYLFLIQPDGTAAYYDHETSQGEPTSPDQVYFCEEMKIEVSAPEKADGERRRQEDIGGQREENERLRRQLVAVDSAALALYMEQIRQKIYRNWSVPASASEDLDCAVRVRQAPGGEVIGVTILTCNGNEAVRRSIEAAIQRSSPLPEPSDPILFDRNILLSLSIHE